MFVRSVNKGNARTLLKRFQSTTSESTASTFNNKYNFNISPPPVHEYWNYRNATVFLSAIPLYFAVGYASVYIASNFEGYSGLLGFKDNEKSPLKDTEFGEPQHASKQ